MTNQLTKRDSFSDLGQWEPLGDFNREIGAFRNRMLSLFGRGNGGEPGLLAEGDEFADWMPAVDVSEDDNEYLTVHVPKSEEKKQKQTEIEVR